MFFKLASKVKQYIWINFVKIWGKYLMIIAQSGHTDCRTLEVVDEQPAWPNGKLNGK